MFTCHPPPGETLVRVSTPETCGKGAGPVGLGFTSAIWEAAFCCRTVCKWQQEAVPGVQWCEATGEWQCEATGQQPGEVTGERHGVATGVQGSPKTKSLWGVATGVQCVTKTECLRLSSNWHHGSSVHGHTRNHVQWGTFIGVLQGTGYAASSYTAVLAASNGGWGDGQSPFQGTP